MFRSRISTSGMVAAHVAARPGEVLGLGHHLEALLRVQQLAQARRTTAWSSAMTNPDRF